VIVDNVIWFALPLNPEQWAIGPVSGGLKNGKPFGRIGANTQLQVYQKAVKELLAPEIEFIFGASKSKNPFFRNEVELFIYIWRNLDEYTNRGGRNQSRPEADLTNLFKATEDAIQDVLIYNDRQSRATRGALLEQERGIEPCVLVGIKFFRLDEVLDEIPEHAFKLVRKIRGYM
jgi:hypothetical protein